jgi:hypothetical protein
MGLAAGPDRVAMKGKEHGVEEGNGRCTGIVMARLRNNGMCVILGQQKTYFRYTV